jgi:hypothetical protein
MTLHFVLLENMIIMHTTITVSMMQGLYWKVCTYSRGQKIILWNPEVSDWVQGSPPSDPIQSIQSRPHPHNLFLLAITLQSSFRSSIWSFLLRFSCQSVVCLSRNLQYPDVAKINPKLYKRTTRAVVERTPRYNYSSTLYPQSCWCIIQVIHSL